MGLYLGLLGLAMGLGLAIAAFGSATAQGKAIASAVDSIGRQPEAAGQIQTAMMIGLAFVEALTIYSLLFVFLLMGRMPSPEAVLEMIRAGAGN